MRKEAGHTFLAKLGKTKLRPGGIDATNWLLTRASIRPDVRVLEVACNMGTTMIQVAQKYGCRVTGLDLDEAALEKAGKNIRAQRLEDRLSVVRGNALALPFADGSFDIVINEAMLTMLVGDRKDKALAEYARVLKPGGALLTHDVCFYEDEPVKRRRLCAGLSRVINVPVEPLTGAEWKERIERHGFRTEQKHGPMTLMDPAGMIRDEGMEGTVRIMFNAMKKENSEMFAGMFNFFRDQRERLGYVANYSVRTD